MAGVTWRDTNPIIKDHHLPWDGPPLTSTLKQMRKPYRLVLFEKLHCVYLRHFGVVANFHLQTSTRLELALFCSEKQIGPYQMRKAYNDQKV